MSNDVNDDGSITMPPEITRTVADVVADLLAMPQDAVVWTEGCDCYGRAGEVHLDPDGTVIIGRTADT